MSKINPGGLNRVAKISLSQVAKTLFLKNQFFPPFLLVFNIRFKSVVKPWHDGNDTWKAQDVRDGHVHTS